MQRGIVWVLAALMLVAAVVVTAPRLRRRAHEVASNMKMMQDDTGDVMASATYQRYATRRRAVEQMRAALHTIAVAESAFVADSGHPTNVFLPETRYAFTIDPATMVSIEIQRDRWVAQARNNHTSMSCSLTALLDTTGPALRYHAGEPVCAEWTADSIAVAAAPAPKPASAAVVEVGNEHEGGPPQAIQEPHKHRDWGPVNNTPPPMPWIVKNECEGEGCEKSGSWAACSTIVALRDKLADAPAVFTIRPGERFDALTADIHVERPGIVVFRDTVSNEDGEALNVDSIRFVPADTLYILNYIGEGYLVWWYRGQADTGYQFWNDEHARGPFSRSVLSIQSQKAVWWVRVRSSAGKEGWIIGDGDRFATGGHYDDVRRCLHTAKG